MAYAKYHQQIQPEDIDRVLPMMDDWFARLAEDPLEMLDVLKAANNYYARQKYWEQRRATEKSTESRHTPERAPS